jgi:segregation and condensation protein B
MAKRKKSKKPAKSKSAKVQAPELVESTEGEARLVEGAEAEPPAEDEARLVEGAEAEPAAEGEAQLAESDEGEPAAEGEAQLAESDEGEPVAEGEARLVESAEGQPAADGEAQLSESAEGQPAADGEAQLSESAEGEPATEGEAQLSENAEGEPATEGEAQATESADGETPQNEALSESQLESIIESLLFASDKALSLSDLKRLIGERDGKKLSAAVEGLIERRKGSGIEVIALSSGWHLRTSAENAIWVSKLLVGRPVRLSRAMLETLAIVAYRQPVTRPEVDDIRGVDCGAVLKTLLDRGLIRIIGKKEEVGRPMLYGTTPEFLRVFNLRDLSELPTLREFSDLSAEDQSRVEAEHGSEPPTPSATTAKPDVALTSVARGVLSPEPEENDPLLDELDEASQLAKKALGDLEPPTAEGEEAAAPAEDKGPPSPATE